MAPRHTSDDLNTLGVAEAARFIAAGRATSLELVDACLARIAEREGEIGAWQYLDADQARAAARARDAEFAVGDGVGPLHGVPIGVKDILDTADMPTENGTAIHAGRRPGTDAAAVKALRDAGAVILGKTVTAELAVFGPGKTRNPRNPAHTPGGSSSGSGAAVADNMVPAALGTQTGGSVIRPASFCGVFGFKPTFGLIARVGCLNQSPPLDTIGVLARAVEDLALVADCLTASDPRDPASYPRSRPPLHAIAREEVSRPPVLAVIRTPMWQRAGAATRKAFMDFAGALGERAVEVTLPEDFSRAWQWHRILQLKDCARNFAPLFADAPEVASRELRELMVEGARYTDEEYDNAVAGREAINAGLDEIFARYDAILLPAATGPAPKGLSSTGDPVFNLLWTYAGVPAVALPLLEVDGLPVGVQLVGRRGGDARLLQIARWLDRAKPGREMTETAPVAPRGSKSLPEPRPSNCSFETFVDRFGGIYEHSPWVARATYLDGLTERDDNASGLAGHMAAMVACAGRDRQLELLRAHPELVGRPRAAGALTAASENEQASAGLTACSPAEIARFRDLNARYHQRFGFPFIIAVHGRDRHHILREFERRLANAQDEEFATALAEVDIIARRRLAAMAAKD